MSFPIRLLLSRMRRTATLAGLRLTGLILAVTLAAAVPVFVAGSMERVLQEQRTVEEDQAVVIGWSAPDTGDYSTGVAALDSYLVERLGPLKRVTATAPSGVQRYAQDGALLAGRRYLKLGALPGGFTAASGRLPEPGQPEVVVADQALARANYQVGDRLRVPLPDDRSVTVTIVGTVSIPPDPLRSAIESSLLTSEEYWESLGLPAGDVTWSVELTDLHAAQVPGLVAMLEELPLRAGQQLEGAEVVATPAVWLSDFARRMAATERFLLVLLAPVFILVVSFIVATANVVIDSRRTEIAVLRSRGATPWQVIRFYLPESGLLAGTALLAGLALATPLARLMGLTAGFLQLVGRPLLPTALTGQALLYALVAALVAESVTLIPLLRATGITVATIRQEAATRSAVLWTLRAVGEVALLGLLAYGTWLAPAGAGSDPLRLALPALFLFSTGLVTLRLVDWGFGLLDRLLRKRLPPPFYLALSLLRHQPSRYRAMSLMLVVTTGLGIYGAAFARTLDRDLIAQVRYRLGADLILRPTWESEVLSLTATGEPDEVVYREPPFTQMLGLPGTQAAARVQTRGEVSLAAGARNLGKADVMAITPREFGQVARFLSDLTPRPDQLLNSLATEEEGAVISASLAVRTGLKPGDQIRVKQNDAEVTLLIAGVTGYWPGRLPEQGDFLVVNLHYVQDGLGIAPYSVWYRLEPGAQLSPIFETLAERAVRIAAVDESLNAIARGRRQPFRLGIYATLSASFVVAVLVMALTYLLGVGLTLQSRAKEFGVLRAMGMTARQVAATLYTEQLALVGVAAGAGLAGGALASALYVPLLRQQPGETLLPVNLASALSDRLSLGVALLVTLILGAVTVRSWLRRLQVQAVLRLGEDG